MKVVVVEIFITAALNLLPQCCTKTIDHPPLFFPYSFKPFPFLYIITISFGNCSVLMGWDASSLWDGNKIEWDRMTLPNVFPQKFEYWIFLKYLLNLFRYSPNCSGCFSQVFIEQFATAGPQGNLRFVPIPSKLGSSCNAAAIDITGPCQGHAL